jgi:alpha-ketoglutarate-dependent taurine dioxygenase
LHVDALYEFRRALSAEAKRSADELRLKPGDALFIDNRRLLHGRRAIAHDSRRTLHRLWVRQSSDAVML